jgi:hypothetical protein
MKPYFQILLLTLASGSDAHGGIIELNAGFLDTRSHAARALADSAKAPGVEKRLYLLQFDRPMQDVWMQQLLATGVQVINAIPQNAYLVYGDGDTLNKIAALENSIPVSWYGLFPKGAKWQQAAANEQNTPDANIFEVQLVNDPVANAQTLALIAQNQPTHASVGTPQPIHQRFELLQFVNLVTSFPAAQLDQLLARPDVISVRRASSIRFQDESQSMIMAGDLIGGTEPNAGNYLDTLARWGFTQAQFDQSNLIVDVTDQGVDVSPIGPDPGTAPYLSNAGPIAQPRHFSLYTGGNPANVSRYVYKGNWSSEPNNSLGYNGHGQLIASVLGGFVPDSLDQANGLIHRDAKGFRYGMGVAPFVRIGNSVIQPGDNVNPAMVAAANASGAKISTNSWNLGGSEYGILPQAYDALTRDAQPSQLGLQPMFFTFAAGNLGLSERSRSIKSPATAKNVLAVGASEGVRSKAAQQGGIPGSLDGLGGCGVRDADADNATDMAYFSSRGPTDDGRAKPDIVAPGTHITGMSYTAAGVNPFRPLNNLGAGDPLFNAEGHCGLLGAGITGSASNYFPFSTGQRWYAITSGTSFATPAAAGGAALIYQQFLNNPAYLAAHRTPSGSAAPSPALMKAFLMNTTRFLSGERANDRLPSMGQGVGAINLGHAFDGVSRVIRDQVAADTFTDSGQSRTLLVAVADPSKPLRVSMVYSDAPGSTVGSAFVNDLDLVVVGAGAKYLGNVFSKEFSITGRKPDKRNNAEHVFLPQGIRAGEVFAIRVDAAAINGDGLPGNGDPTDQDFALVIYNATAVNDQSVIAFESAQINTPDQILQPNDCIPLTTSLRNGGTQAAANVTASLQSASAGVLVSNSTSSFPLINPGAISSSANDYTLSTSSGLQCASTINLSHQVKVGNLSFTTPIDLQVGAPTRYQFSTTSGQIPAGGQLIPFSATDDRLFAIPAPFAVKVYDKSVASGESIFVSTNGVIQLNDEAATSWHLNEALPSSQLFATSILPYWDELVLNSSSLSGGGIYQQINGTAPNRTWIIEWRAKRPEDSGNTATLNFAVAFHENRDLIEFIYGSVGQSQAGGASASIGLQAKDSRHTSYSVNAVNTAAGQKIRFERIPGACTSGRGNCAVQANGFFANGFED